MKRDLDRLMAERNIDVLVVEGPDGLGSANPDFNYFVNGTHAAQADFEAALNKIAAGTNSGYVVVDKVGPVQTHRLTLNLKHKNRRLQFIWDFTQ